MDYKETRDKVEAFMSDRTDWTTHAEAVIHLSSQLHIEMSSDKYVGLTGEGRVFDGQVRRALADLAGRGVLVGRKRIPLGYHKARLEYVTARQHDVLTRQRMDDAAAEERQRAADQELIDGFAKLGHNEVGVTKTHQLTMTRAEAGRILAVLEEHAQELEDYRRVTRRPSRADTVGPSCPHGNISRVTCNECV